MEDSLSTAPLWSYGIAAISYLAFSLHLLRWRHGNLRDPVDITLLFAMALTAMWAAEGFLLVLRPASYVAIAQQVFDSLRYGAWYAFAILLLRTARVQSGPAQPLKAQWPTVVGGAIIVFGLAFQALLATGPTPSEALLRGSQYAVLAQTIFGLVRSSNSSATPRPIHAGTSNPWASA